MKPEVSSAIQNVFEAMFFSELIDCGDGMVGMPAIGAAIQFSGTIAGEFRLAVSKDTAARLLDDFLAAERPDDNSDPVICMVEELANVACGAVLSAMQPGLDAHFSVPLRLSESKMRPMSCFSTTGDCPDVGVAVMFEERPR